MGQYKHSFFFGPSIAVTFLEGYLILDDMIGMIHDQDSERFETKAQLTNSIAVLSIQSLKRSYLHIVFFLFLCRSLKNFSITAAAQQMVTDPLNMIQNVDIRSPSSSSSSSLSEAGAEDEDDQNCISAIFNPGVAFYLCICGSRGRVGGLGGGVQNHIGSPLNKFLIMYFK